MKLKILKYEIFYGIRFVIHKYCISFCRIPIIYRFWQKYFKIKSFENFVNYINGTSLITIKNNWDIFVDSLIQYIGDKLEKSNKIYIYLGFPSTGEYCIFFIILRQFLISYKGEINIICCENTKDIAKLYGTYFNIKKYYCIPKSLSYMRDMDVIKYYIGIRSNITVLDMTKWLIENPFYKLYVKDDSLNFGMLWYYFVEKKHLEMLGNENCNIRPKYKYIFDNINNEKIDSVLKCCKNGKIYLCNFESKSFKTCIDDEILFEDYLKEINRLAVKYDIKFVVNSVYNREKLINTKNILVTRLNFQEIIFLAENKKIKLFISERNGLNDVFNVFYKDINQIVYYPDYYDLGVSKKIYIKQLPEKYDLIHSSHLYGRNIVEYVRAKFTKTIELELKNIL